MIVIIMPLRMRPIVRNSFRNAIKMSDMRNFIITAAVLLITTLISCNWEESESQNLDNTEIEADTMTKHLKPFKS